jgi:hypothetical protein
MMPIFMVLRPRPRAFSTRPKSEGDFLGSVHLGLDDVHAARAAVAQGAQFLQVVQGHEAGDHGVEDAFLDLLAVQKHGVRGHEVADVAYEQHAAAGQDQGGTIRRGVLTVGIQAALDGFAALGEVGRQVASQEAEPVGVGLGLVLAVHRRDGVLEVHDGGHGGFQYHVLESRRVRGADGVVPVDVQFDMQPVVGEKQHAGGEAGEGAGIGESCRPLAHDGLEDPFSVRFPARVLDDVGVASPDQGQGLVQEGCGVFHDRRAAYGVVGARARRAVVLGQHVRAVEGVVETAPPGVGRVQGIAGIGGGHHQLRPGDGRNLGIHARGGDGEGFSLGHGVADGLEKCFVLGRVVRAAGPFAVPRVDLFLQVFAFLQQFAVARGEVADEAFQGSPEVRCGHSGAGCGLFADQVIQGLGDVQSADGNVGHGLLLGFK